MKILSLFARVCHHCPGYQEYALVDVKNLNQTLVRTEFIFDGS